MRTVRMVGFGLALLAGSASPAVAQNAGGINYQELFQELDANGDRVIDRAEVPESGRAAFDQLVKNADSNKDGKIDQEEYRGMLASIRDAFAALGGRFSEIDKDGDGKISKGEYPGPLPLFARIDADGDGVLTKDEVAKFRPGPGGGAGANAAMLAQRLRAMDKDGDGRVSRGEFSGQPGIFDRLDANKDGFLSRGEIPGGGGGAGPDRATMLKRILERDRNGDGKISKDEFEGPAPFFDRLDTNGDGFLTTDELRGPGAAPGAGKAGAKATRRPTADDAS